MILLNTHSIELVSTTTSQIDVSTSFVNIASGTGRIPNSSEAQITTATTTAIVATPAVSEQRQVILLNARNSGLNQNTVTIQKKIGATIYTLYSANLLTGESITYAIEIGFRVFNARGEEKKSEVTNPLLGSKSYNILKVGGGTEAAGLIHSLALTTGIPSAWSPGTPGLAGRITDGTNVSDLGCLLVSNPVSGTNYITQLNATASGACTPQLADILWVNTGLVITTTTAQTINSVAFPARDDNFSSNGQGVNVGILVTASTTNVGAVANITMSYTNSDNTAGRSATMSAFPATATLGALIPFQLQAGDKGVRSIQSITIGTSLVSGSISLVAYKIYAQVPGFISNGGGSLNDSGRAVNIKIPNNVCLLPQYVATGTGATTLQYFINVEEK
jgi:hypothetical protein